MALMVNRPCRRTLTGKDDNQLVTLAKQHVKEHHPDATRSEDEIRQLVTQMAQDA